MGVGGTIVWLVWLSTSETINFAPYENMNIKIQKGESFHLPHLGRDVSKSKAEWKYTLFQPQLSSLHVVLPSSCCH